MNGPQLFDALGVIPALPGARCRGRHHLFDPREPHEQLDVASDRHRQARGLCHHCPALTACRQWVDGLPVHRRPRGVVAARGGCNAPFHPTPKGQTEMSSDHGGQKSPRDVVPPTPPTREQLLAMDASAGTVMNVVEPGEVITDPDGTPIGVGPPTTTAVLVGGAVVYRDWLDAAGLTEDDVENLKVIDRKPSR